MIWEQVVKDFIEAPKIPTNLAPPTHKVCSDCKEEKPLKEFYERQTSAKTTSQCKTCYKQYLKQLKEKQRAKTL